MDNRPDNLPNLDSVTNNQRGFEKTLNLALSDWIIKYRHSSNPIISLGAATGSELPVLANIFPNATIIRGVDKDPLGREWLEKILAPTDKRIDYMTCDASSPEAYRDISGKDLDLALIVIRAPDITVSRRTLINGDSNWDSVLETATKHLAPDGRIVMTGSNLEMNVMENMLTKRGLLVDKIKNPHQNQRSVFHEEVILVAKT